MLKLFSATDTTSRTINVYLDNNFMPDNQVTVGNSLTLDVTENYLVKVLAKTAHNIIKANITIS